MTVYYEMVLADADDVSKALETKANQLPQKSTATVYDIGNAVRNAAIGLAPVRTGFLKNSHVFELLSPYEGVMYPDAPYAPFVILGHNIVARGRGGRWHMKRIVGRTKPNPYLQNSVVRANPEIQRILVEFTAWMEA